MWGKKVRRAEIDAVLARLHEDFGLMRSGDESSGPAFVWRILPPVNGGWLEPKPLSHPLGPTAFLDHVLGDIRHAADNFLKQKIGQGQFSVLWATKFSKFEIENRIWRILLQKYRLGLRPD
jgi:hypothetical protein